jgi:hypothetical protein
MLTLCHFTIPVVIQTHTAQFRSPQYADKMHQDHSGRSRHNSKRAGHLFCAGESHTESNFACGFHPAQGCALCIAYTLAGFASSLPA